MTDRADPTAPPAPAPSPAATPIAAPTASPVAAPAAPRRPPYIPAKFWDEAKGAVRIEALAKSYGQLERRFTRDRQQSQAVPPLLAPAADPAAADAAAPPALAPPAPDSVVAADVAGSDAADAERDGAPVDPAEIPPAPEQYRIRLGDGPVERDAEIDGLLHAAGFTQAQAQLVYDLAAERVAPLFAALADHYAKSASRARLEARFGGPERFAQISRQIHAYGEAHLAPEVYRALAASEDGIVTLHRLMQAGEPRLVGGRGGGGGLDDAALRKLVQDPRYWRDRDPAVIARVEAGYRRLYPNGAGA